MIRFPVLLLLVLLLNVIPASWTDAGPLSRMGTWQNRITHFGASDDLSEEEYYAVTDENYQVAHAKIAIANGGVVGVFTPLCHGFCQNMCLRSEQNKRVKLSL